MGAVSEGTGSTGVVGSTGSADGVGSDDGDGSPMLDGPVNRRTTPRPGRRATDVFDLAAGSPDGQSASRTEP